MKKTLLNLAIFAAGLAGAQAQLHLFTENMGSSTGTQTIPATTFQNSATLTYSGTGDTRTSTGSTGYTGASGGKNVFLTNGGTRSFTIDNINTLGFSGFSLSYGANKSTTASDLSDLTVNGVAGPAQATGTGSTGWRLITITPTIASSTSASIEWINGSTTNQARLDDVTLAAAKYNRTGANALTTTANVGLTVLNGTVFGAGATQTEVALASNITGGTNTTASILNANITADRNLTMSFNTISAAANDSDRVSDVFNLTGTATNTFVLQLSTGVANSTDSLGWLSGGEWVEATTGNTGAGALAGFHGASWSAFVAGNGGTFNAVSMLGAYGNDGAGNVWAVLNHNSSFAVVIPEPHEYALMFAGLLGLVIVLRRVRSNRVEA